MCPYEYISDEKELDCFHIDDPNLYLWRVENPHKSVGFRLNRLLAGTLSWTVSSLAYYFILLLISRVSQLAAFWIGAILGLIFLFSIPVIVVESFKQDMYKKEAFISSFRFALSGSIGILLFLMSSPASIFYSGFMGETSSGIGPWIIYFLDNSLNVLLLDVPEVFGYSLSSIEPTAWYSQAITVVLRLVIASGLVEGGLVLYRSIFTESQFSGTVQDCYWKCSAMLPGLGGEKDLILYRDGEYIDTTPMLAVSMSAFRDYMFKVMKSRESLAA